MGVMNHKRAAWARVAIDAFIEEVGGKDEGLQTHIGDLMCDLLHLANQNSMDADAVHQHALDMYEGEIADDE